MHKITQFTHHFCTLLFALLVNGCISDPDDEIVGRLFSDEPIAHFFEHESYEGKPHLRISNQAYAKEFFLYGAFIPMLKAANGHTLKGRIVRFYRSGDRVWMFESSEGHAVTTELPSTILLAEFPIIKEDAQGVLVDFSRGMNNAFTARNVYSAGAGHTEQGTEEQFQTVTLQTSFIESITEDQDVLTIRQIAQLRSPKKELLSAEFRYFIHEYPTNNTFIKKPFAQNRWVEYFSTPPHLVPQSSVSETYVTYWDLSRPIMFYISANTPKEHLAAIKDGIIFWNHIFGREVFRVDIAPKDVLVPHPKLNVIQWVPWDNEASAYADMVTDHRTGEILQAQIYLRSGWVFRSAQKLRNQLQELLVDSPGLNQNGPEENIPLPEIFSSANVCQENSHTYDALQELVQQASETHVSNKVLQILTNDVIRAVIAHEMGHILGLRHNLAGSLQGNLAIGRRKELLREYLTTGNLSLTPDERITHTVMDVYSAGDDALIGNQIKGLLAKAKTSFSAELPKIFSYDKEAIHYGYDQKPMSGNEIFCTDEDMKKYLDCKRWDYGAETMLHASDKLSETFKQIAMVFVDTYLQSISQKKPGGPIPVKDVYLSTTGALKLIEANMKSLFEWFSENGRSIFIEQQFPARGPHNVDEINNAKFASLQKQLQGIPLETALFPFLPPTIKRGDSAKLALDIFHKYLNRRRSDSPLEDTVISLSEAQVEQLTKIGERFFLEFETEFLELFLGAIGQSRFDDPKLQLPIESLLTQIAQEIILATKPLNRLESVKELPEFIYPLNVRAAAVLLLSPTIGILPDWSYEGRNKLERDFANLVRSYLHSADTEKLDLNHLTRKQRQWYFEQKYIASIFSRVGSLSRPVPPKAPNTNHQKDSVPH